MSISKFLAFDFGAESCRAIVGILEKGKISTEEIHRFPTKQIIVLGHLHWDHSALFDEIKNSLKLCVGKGHPDIQSIGIDTWGVDFGFVDKDNCIIGFPYCYRDSRTNGIMEKVFELMPMEEVYKSTGIQFMQFNSIYQLYRTKLSNNNLLNNVDKALFMPDLFNFMLTGVKKNEYTIATTSQMLNACSKKFDYKIFSALGLPSKITADIIYPGSIVGKLLPNLAVEVGLGEIDVVAVGCHDTASAIAAVPVQLENWAYLSSGTWSLIGIEINEPIINQQSLKNNFTNEGGVFGTIRFLKNVMGLWLLQQSRKSWSAKGEEFSYDEIAKFALEAEEFESIINPDDPVFLNPPDMLDAIRNYCSKTNQIIPQTTGEFARTIFESLAIKYRDIINSINEICNYEIEKLHVVGGGSQNKVLNQLTADACGIPVIAGPVEATALGNILVQAIAKGKIESIAQGRKIIAESFPVKVFTPKNSSVRNNISIK